MDLHVHTRFSGDSSITPKILVEQLHAHPFIKGVAITDHDTTLALNYVRTLVKSYEHLVVIPGIEVTTTQGHLIILGIAEEPPHPLTAKEAADFGLERGGVIMAPHPFRPNSGLAGSVKEMNVHAIEVLNSRATSGENSMALELAKTMGVSRVAGSDCHLQEEMWTAYTEIEAEPTVDSILKAIKMGKTKPHKSP